LSRGGANCSAVLSCAFSSVLRHCYMSFCAVLHSSVNWTAVQYSCDVLYPSTLFGVVLIFCCFYLRCCLVTCYFHCVTLLSIALWLGLKVFDKLTVHQMSGRWTKLRNLHIMKKILDSNQEVALTRRDKYILEISRWLHFIKYRTLRPTCYWKRKEMTYPGHKNKRWVIGNCN
jgi:hypothetical protein